MAKSISDVAWGQFYAVNTKLNGMARILKMEDFVRVQKLVLAVV